MAARRPEPPRAYDSRIDDLLAYAGLASLATPTTTEFPLAPGAGVRFGDPIEDPDGDTGRLALIVAPGPEGTQRTTLVVELIDGWSVAAHLSSGQLHRLTNGLAGRGTRNAVRPFSVDDTEHVHLSGSPTTLVVEFGDRVVEIPAGPKRGLSKALRALELESLAG
ncbi:MAG: hypothetical protein Q7T55_02430 [Solirubrobacteraceae bacterium]|nr:hypothetical protein [Solirubrobacteraceae bacterium]